MKPETAMTLRLKLIATTYLSLLVPVLVLCIVCYYLFGYNARNSRIAADGDLSLQLSENLSYAIYTADTLVRNIIYSPELQRLMGDYSVFLNDDNLQPEMSRLSFQLSANNMLKSHDNNLSAVTNISLYGADGRVLASIGASRMEYITDYCWFAQLDATQGESLWLTTHRQPANSGNTLAVPLVKQIRSLSGTNSPRFGSTIGYFLADVNLEWFLRSIGMFNHESSTNIYLLDATGQVIGNRAPSEWEGQFPFQLSDEANGKIVRDDNNGYYLLTLRRMQNTGWYVACLSDYDGIMSEARLAVRICVLTALLLLIGSLFASIRNAGSVVRPVTALRTAFKRMESGDFSEPDLHLTGITELDDLSGSFRVMVKRLDTLINEVYASSLKEQRLIAEAQRSQIEALQMQINPHFIYNTLDSINWMALMGGNQDVSRMVLALGEVLRFNVSIRQLYTSVQSEIANTERYMYIQHIRFQPWLKYHVDVPEALLGRSVLKLLVQPLVENSVNHGMASGRDCMLEVRVREEADVLSVEVTDDGIGMPPHMLEELREIWRDVVSGRPVPDKVGITNIMKRLHLCYGDKADFKMDSRPGKGTRVVITFPAVPFAPGDKM